MKKSAMAVLAAGMVFMSGSLVYSQEAMEKSANEPKEFGGVVTGLAEESATVESINVETRTVTLKNEAGQLADVPCGPEVKNFDQIKVGDTVTVRIDQYAEITVMQGANAPLARSVQQDVASAPLGQKPQATIASTLRVMAMVQNIDYAAREVTVQGPERTVTVHVGPDAKNFEKVKKGDNVYLELTQHRKISVS